MASPTYVSPLVASTGTIADAYLALHAEGARRRWAQAQAAADEAYARDQAQYAAIVEAAQARREAAEKELAAAQAARAKLDVEDAKGQAQALRDLQRTSVMRDTLKGIAAANARPALAPVNDHIREDPTYDKMQEDLSKLTSWDQVYPRQASDASDLAFKDRKKLDDAWEAVAGLSVRPGIKRALAVGIVLQGGGLQTIGTEKLKEAALREALLGNTNITVVMDDIGAGFEKLAAQGVISDVEDVQRTIGTLLDTAAKDGDTAREAADSLEAKAKKKPSGGGAGARDKAKLEAAENVLEDPERFRPDFSEAKAAADQRIADAEARLAGIEMPDEKYFASRIERTRAEHDRAFGTTRGRRAIPWEDLVAELRRSAPSAAPPPSKVGPQANTPHAQAKEAAAMAVVLEPTPANVIRPPTYEMDAKEKADAKAGRSQSAAAPAPGRSAPSESWEDYFPPQSDPPADEDAPSPNRNPALDDLDALGFGDDDEPAEVMDLDETYGEGDITARHRPLLEAHGLVARDGKPRRNRIARLAENTDQGRQARAALDDSGDDLEAALKRLRDPYARAIAVGLRA